MLEELQKELFLRYIVLSLIFWISGFSSPSYAQFEDLGDILKDIMGDTTLPGQTPIYGENGIENIPVSIRYDVSDSDADRLKDARLVLSAFVPNDPGGKTIKPIMLGQTQLLLTGLQPPLQVIIAVPEPVTRDLTYARITAHIMDVNGNNILIAERDGIYRGTEPPELTLIAPSGLPKAEETSLQTLYGLELIEGVIELSGNHSLVTGSTLTIQLLENALAGGTSTTIAAELVQNLDGSAHPIPFTLERSLYGEQKSMPLALKAWITDWAGRKTHVMRSAVNYNGPDISYTLPLDRLAQGQYTAQGRNLDPALMAQAIVHGEAIIDRNYGLPNGAKLTVKLMKSVSAYGEDRTLSNQTIIIAPNTSRIPFSLSTDSTQFDPLIPAPHLELQVVDDYGNIYFESGQIQAQEGRQAIQLYARRR